MHLFFRHPVGVDRPIGVSHSISCSGWPFKLLMKASETWNSLNACSSCFVIVLMNLLNMNMKHCNII